MRTKKLPRKYLAVAIMSATLFSSGANAEINWNGFAQATGGLVLSDDESLHGYDDDFGFKTDTFLGLQANADLGSGLTAVAQVISRGADEWDTKMEWAYIGYEANDNLKILLGRQRMPFYMYSSYLDVGYAYHWIRPPEATYSVPFNSTDGVSILYTSAIGVVDSTLQLIYGRNQDSVNAGGGVKSSADFANMAGFSWTLEYDWLSFRAGYSQSDMKIELTDLYPVAQGWAAAGQQIAQLMGNPAIATEWAGFADYILADDDNNTGSFSGIGFTIDYNDFVVASEYTSLGTEGSIFQKEQSGYFLSFGKRFGNLMPHITYGASESTPQDTDFLDGVPTGLDAGIDGLLAATQGLYATAEEKFSYYIVGLRWNFHDSAAFKVDYKSQSNDIGDEETVNLIRFSVATVF